jgi:hypothetical protein
MKANDWLAATCFCIGIIPSAGFADCAYPTSVPKSSAALHLWESNHNVKLTAGAEARFGRSLCDAIDRVSAQSGASVQEIDGTSKSGIWQYLNDTYSENATVTSLASRIGADYLLGANPMLPEPVSMTLLHIYYVRHIDAISVGGAIIRGAPPLLMAEIGTLQISGISNSTSVCSAKLMLHAGGTNAFHC